MPVVSLRLSVVLLTDSLVINRVSIAVCLFEWLTELRKIAYLLDYQFAIKIQLRNSQIEATRRTRFVGRYTCLLQDHHPQHLHVSTSPEAQTPTLETFMEDSSNRHDQLLTQSLASFPP